MIIYDDLVPHMIFRMTTCTQIDSINGQKTKNIRGEQRPLVLLKAQCSHLSPKLAANLAQHQTLR